MTQLTESGSKSQVKGPYVNVGKKEMMASIIVTLNISLRDIDAVSKVTARFMPHVHAVLYIKFIRRRKFEEAHIFGSMPMALIATVSQSINPTR